MVCEYDPELMSDEVLFEKDAGIARVTINRPERRNAMSFAVMQGLRDAFARARADDDVRVVVLTGAGDKAFCAGADLGGGGIADSGASAHDGRGIMAALFRDMWQLGKPVIARIRGYALAGGFGLACACDLIVASDDSVFGTPEINVGLWPYMITVPLLRSMPPKTALDLMMTGRRVVAEEGARIGFVQRVVPAAELDATVDALASELAAKSPIIMRWGRDAFYRALEMDADAALSYLQGMLTITSQTEDSAEGVAAFAEKRAPRWKGR
jgi:enoyl-CoA hydratase/carnithine racemase